jgi:DNA-binding transcriptional LysR family regulator
MEIQQLRHFLAAVRFGNIGHAADKLYITQSGLSRSIKNLEDSLGLQLLKRNPRGVEPTPFGLALLPRAQAILNEHERAVEELNAIRKAQKGSIKVGLTLNFTHYYAPEVISGFLSGKRGVDVVVISGSYPELIEKLQIAEIDFVFGLFGVSGPESGDLVAEPLFQSRSIVLSRPDHALAAKKSVTPEDLSKAEWAMLDSSGFQQAFMEYFQAKGCAAPRQVIRTNSLAFLRRAVINLGLLTILPEPLVKDEIERRDLVPVKCETPAGMIPAGIVHRKNEVVTPAMRDLMAMFRKLEKKREPASAR